jgi:predicted RecA/RadA family phage recombinase
MSLNLATERHAGDDKLLYTAGSNIKAGTPVLTSIGTVGIPANDIASGDTDEVDVSGRFRAWGVASQAWVVGDRVGWDANGSPLNGTASSGAYTKTVSDWDFPVGTVVEAKGATTEMGVILLDEPAQIDIPQGAQQALSGAGAVNVTSYSTVWTSGGAVAGTLANGVRIGQLKEIMLTVAGGTGTLTPATASGFTTIAFSVVGDMVLLEWTASGWIILKRYNVATGAITTPVAA